MGTTIDRVVRDGFSEDVTFESRCKDDLGEIYLTGAYNSCPRHKAQ